MKEAFIKKNFRRSSLELLAQVNNVIDEYQAMGYDLTLRQIYYQLVAGDIIPNNERSYKNLGSLISDGRLAGAVDWNAVVDRTRMLRALPHWESPAEIIEASANQFRFDKWEGQDHYVEVWVEKDALIGVVERIANKLDIPYFSCRGYVSQSEMYSAAKRLIHIEEEMGKAPIILHLGDHDPSGIDMSRDIQERLSLFGTNPLFRRLALNMNQIEEFNPPPNPTKLSDSRAGGYIETFGYTSWELDALKPEVLDKLVTNEVDKYLDRTLFDKMQEKQDDARATLREVSDNWDEVVETYGKQEEEGDEE